MEEREYQPTKNIIQSTIYVYLYMTNYEKLYLQRTRTAFNFPLY